MTAFDPYHVWLGIPPDEQPANYYRLLGLRTFEANSDVIDHAADRQMAHLRSFSTGERAGIAQKLLNEVSAARVCLLDAAKKAEYDARLRTALMPPGVVPPAVGSASPPASAAPPSTRAAWKQMPIPVAPVASAPPVAMPQPTSPVKSAPLVVGSGSKRSLSRRSSPVLSIAIVSLVILVGAIAVGVMNSNSDDENKNMPDSVASNDKPAERVTDKEQQGKTGDGPAVDPAPTPVVPMPVDEIPAGATPTTPSSEAPDSPPAEVPRPKSPPNDENPKENNPNDELPFDPSRLDSSPDALDAPPVDRRVPIPDEVTRAAKEKEIRALLAKEFAQTRPQEVWEFGRQLLAVANETKNDPVGRYVSYTLAIERAGQAGDAESARAAAEKIAEEYNVERVDVVGKAVLDAARGGVPVVVRVVAMKHASELAKQAFAADRLELAKGLADEWIKLAMQVRDVGASTEARECKERVVAALERWPAVAEGMAKLKSNPDDKSANLTVGRYLCFIKEEWRRGLEMLSKGNDAAIGSLVGKELAAVGDSNALVDVAESWAAYKGNLNAAERRAVERHVLDVLIRALPTAAGLTRTRIIEGIHRVQRNHEDWLDLHAVTVPARDGKRGEWTRDEQGNISGAIGSGTGSLSTIIDPQGSYEFTCEFTRLGPAGDIAFFVPVEDRMCVVALAGYDNAVSWIDAVDGHGYSDRNPTMVRPPNIPSGVRHAMHVTVRAKGDAAQVLVRLNGKDYMGYRGNLARLNKVNFADAANDPKLLGVGMWQTHVLFHTLKYRAIK